MFTSLYIFKIVTPEDVTIKEQSSHEWVKLEIEKYLMANEGWNLFKIAPSNIFHSFLLSETSPKLPSGFRYYMYECMTCVLLA